MLNLLKGLIGDRWGKIPLMISLFKKADTVEERLISSHMLTTNAHSQSGFKTTAVTASDWWSRGDKQPGQPMALSGQTVNKGTRQAFSLSCVWQAQISTWLKSFLSVCSHSSLMRSLTYLTSVSLLSGTTCAFHISVNKLYNGFSTAGMLPWRSISPWKLCVDLKRICLRN